MYEIRIELVEVEEPGGEIVGVPLASGESAPMGNKEDAARLYMNAYTTLQGG